MGEYERKQKVQKGRTIANSVDKKRSNFGFTFQFVDNRSEGIVQPKMQEKTEISLKSQELKAFQNAANDSIFIKSQSAGQPLIQRKIWGSGFTPYTKTQVLEIISKHMTLSNQDCEDIIAIHNEVIDYQLPESEEDISALVQVWLQSYRESTLINISKMLSIVNSVLARGVLNQADRQKFLTKQQTAITSTDSSVGSKNVHGMLLNVGERNIDGASARAEQDMVNVMAEVKDDPMLANMYKRINAKVLEKDERDFLITNLNGMWAEGYCMEPKDKLVEFQHNSDPQVIPDIPSFAVDWLKKYCAQKIYKSQRGKNELNKRMLTGFVSIMDPSAIPKNAWSIRSDTTEASEAVAMQSFPPTAILKMILPKYFEQYLAFIENPCNIPLVFRTIDYPVEAEVHIYSASGLTMTVNREIDLHWRDEIARTMLELERKTVFTSMTRGN